MFILQLQLLPIPIPMRPRVLPQLPDPEVEPAPQDLQHLLVQEDQVPEAVLRVPVPGPVLLSHVPVLALLKPRAQCQQTQLPQQHDSVPGLLLHQKSVC